MSSVKTVVLTNDNGKPKLQKAHERRMKQSKIDSWLETEGIKRGQYYAALRQAPVSEDKLLSIFAAHGLAKPELDVDYVYDADDSTILSRSPAPPPTCFGITTEDLDTRFVPLALMADQGEESQQPPRPFDDLRAVLRDTPEDAVLVVLGTPGAGKTTLLARLERNLRLEREAAQSNGQGKPERIPFAISLAEYKTDSDGKLVPPPLEWLAAQWKERYSAEPPLAKLLGNGRMLLLLDALNEMPHGNKVEYGDRVNRWRAFLREHIRNGNRAVVACRTLDYSVALSTPEMRVPQVHVQPMNDDRVQEFLRAYLQTEKKADETWRSLQADSNQLGLYRVPFYLKMLTDLGGGQPVGRARLFTRFVRQLLRREVAKNPTLRHSGLLTDDDWVRLNNNAVVQQNPTFLPDEGPFIRSLSALAYGMQDCRDTTEQSLVRMPRGQAIELMGTERAADIVEAACSMSLLHRDLHSDPVHVMFYHQLLQEFFAARRMANAPNPDLVRVEWRTGKCAPSLDETIATLASNAPLPPLPGTGWEETAVIAAGLSPDPEAFVRSLSAQNLPLAARCAVEPEIRVTELLKSEIRTALIDRLRAPDIDLRARIAVGLALGRIGNPRFERRTGPHGDYLVPPLALIKAGTYSIGSARNDREKPLHLIRVEAFRIGVFPVTNAEFALFIAAKGYEDKRWWEGAAASAWLAGQGRVEGSNRSAEQAKRQRITEPAFWRDDTFNSPGQPVTGICRHEARAYCAWLSAQTDSEFRLPTEAEFEAASCGLAGRETVCSAEFDRTRCNTFDSHIRRSTPVGMFDNATPEGVHDLSGNVWEWTSSLYRRYPYDAGDGRENVDTDGLRVMRGGSWKLSRHVARATTRGSYAPDARYSDFGFRLALSTPRRDCG